MVPGVGLPPVPDIGASLERGLADGAALSGATFVNLKGPSKDAPMCSRHRWLVGLIDTTADVHNLPLHATDEALETIGRIAAR